jgi:hypothetical protein
MLLRCLCEHRLGDPRGRRMKEFIYERQPMSPALSQP